VAFEHAGGFCYGVLIKFDFRSARLVTISFLSRIFGGIEIFPDIVKGVEIDAGAGTECQY
jgi:hypothetical protein